MLKQPMLGIKAAQLQLAPLGPMHIEDATAVHLQAFPTFFLSTLGPNFLKELYTAFLTDDSAVAFVAASEKGKVLGVVIGSTKPSGFYRRLLVWRWWAFGLAASRVVIQKPSIIPRLIRAFTYRGDAPPGGSRALLSSIAIAPSAQGRGIGRVLMNRWLETVRQEGSTGAYLTTDADDNEVTNQFYQALDWRIESVFTTPHGRRMNRYIIDFAEA